MTKTKCSSCGAELDKGVIFKCPACGKYLIARCDHCRKVSAKYNCGCGFEGP